MSSQVPILVTGAAPGKIGAIGFKIVQLLRQPNLPVCATVRSLDDHERCEPLRRLGATVVACNLANVQDVSRVMSGCQRVYFGMSASDEYLEAALNVIAVAKAQQ